MESTIRTDMIMGHVFGAVISLRHCDATRDHFQAVGQQRNSTPRD